MTYRVTSTQPNDRSVISLLCTSEFKFFSPFSILRFVVRLASLISPYLLLPETSRVSLLSTLPVLGGPESRRRARSDDRSPWVSEQPHCPAGARSSCRKTAEYGSESPVHRTQRPCSQPPGDRCLAVIRQRVEPSRVGRSFFCPGLPYAVHPKAARSCVVKMYAVVLCFNTRTLYFAGDFFKVWGVPNCWPILDCLGTPRPKSPLPSFHPLTLMIWENIE